MFIPFNIVFRIINSHLRFINSYHIMVGIHFCNVNGTLPHPTAGIKNKRLVACNPIKHFPKSFLIMLLDRFLKLFTKVFFYRLFKIGVDTFLVCRNRHITTDIIYHSRRKQIYVLPALQSRYQYHPQKRMSRSSIYYQVYKTQM